MGKKGFEPINPEETDLQSAATRHRCRLPKLNIVVLSCYSLAFTVPEFDFNESAYSLSVQRAFFLITTPDCAFLGDTTTQRFTIQ